MSEEISDAPRKAMTPEEYIEHVKAKPYIEAGTRVHECMHRAADAARRITAKLNNAYRDMDEVRALFSELTGKDVDASFALFPPFYTDFGKNITVGKGVFINSGCCFQDQGGIELGDGCLVGHQVVIATLNHELDPRSRGDMTAAPVKLGKRVWVGAHATILPGVSVGDGAVIAAGAVVTKDVPANCVVAGVPARVVKKIEA